MAPEKQGGAGGMALPEDASDACKEGSKDMESVVGQEEHSERSESADEKEDLVLCADAKEEEGKIGGDASAHGRSKLPKPLPVNHVLRAQNRKAPRTKKDATVLLLFSDLRGNGKTSSLRQQYGSSLRACKVSLGMTSPPATKAPLDCLYEPLSALALVSSAMNVAFCDTSGTPAPVHQRSAFSNRFLYLPKLPWPVTQSQYVSHIPFDFMIDLRLHACAAAYLSKLGLQIGALLSAESQHSSKFSSLTSADIHPPTSSCIERKAPGLPSSPYSFPERIYCACVEALFCQMENEGSCPRLPCHAASWRSLSRRISPEN
eukprot:scaffold109_cov252-Pinguiococcus_pyrenoidosus.AAC.35